ncbi:MAG: Gfo/Idh/MocA family oxidoreductase [Melioribacteraceae bacterium]
MKKKNSNRRSFIKKMAIGSAAIAAAPTILTAKDKSIIEIKSVNKAELNKNISANDNIQIAVIGAGGMGSSDVRTSLKIPGVKLVSACDLYEGRLRDAKENWGKDIFTTKDYREILERKDIDAVIIGTPDHWHQKISVDAMNSGKHVYCEKPMVHKIEEGYDVIKAQNKNNVVFEVGSQGLSSLGNEKAKELLKDGAIGELNYAEGFWARNSPTGAWQYDIPDDASADTVDWKRFLKDNEYIPFDPLRFFRWRNYLDYGTAMAGDLFVHLFSSLHFITSSVGPEKIAAMGGLRFWKDGREVPDVLLGMFDYPVTKEHPGFNLSLRCNFVDGTSGTTYLKLVGSDGSMDVMWDKVVLRTNEKNQPQDAFLKGKLAEGNSKISSRKKMLPPRELIYQVEKDYQGASVDHHTNFYNAIRTGGTVVEDATFGLRACAPALACNNSYFNNKYINWDPIKMKLK